MKAKEFLDRIRGLDYTSPADELQLAALAFSGLIEDCGPSCPHEADLDCEECAFHRTMTQDGVIVRSNIATNNICCVEYPAYSAADANRIGISADWLVKRVRDSSENKVLTGCVLKGNASKEFLEVVLNHWRQLPPLPNRVTNV